MKRKTLSILAQLAEWIVVFLLSWLLYIYTGDLPLWATLLNYSCIVFMAGLKIYSLANGIYWKRRLSKKEMEIKEMVAKHEMDFNEYVNKIRTKYLDK